MLDAGVTANYTTNSVTAYTNISTSGGGFQPPSPTYDANGNTFTLPRLDGTALTLTWNINNEQITATNASGDSTSYQYDALGRRTKRVETIGGNTTTPHFFTNGWNVELEHNGSDYTNRMSWGHDLSESLQGAGGVGGLIMVETLPAGGGSPIPHFPTYDGNGNITAWVDSAGTVVARQRYDAFGNIIQQQGTAPSNYGFSTKPMKTITGLLYYGFRYYDPVTGRWPSRDPIEEKGGLNMYAFVVNDSIGYFDIKGHSANQPKPSKHKWSCDCSTSGDCFHVLDENEEQLLECEECPLAAGTAKGLGDTKQLATIYGKTMANARAINSCKKFGCKALNLLSICICKEVIQK